jgi:N-succinyldiaminopimelate aminotransferase
MSLIDPGDEVIVFEPCYDCYVPSICMAGGVPVAVTLHAPEFRFDPEKLRAAFSPRTKALVLNTPHNPTGIVYSLDELELVAELCRAHDVLAITDEVYEHILFDDVRHIRLATLPGMRERTLTIGGAGKTFSCTGWRIGWAIGPAVLHDAIARLRQFTVFAAATPFQVAIATGLHFSDSYFVELAAHYEAQRDLMVDALASLGLSPSRPEGGCFVLVDISSCPQASGREFCADLASRVGVVPVPLDSFYLHEGLGRQLVRFAFCAARDALATAVNRMAGLRASLWSDR